MEESYNDIAISHWFDIDIENDFQKKETTTMGQESSVNGLPGSQSGGHRFMSRSSKCFFVQPQNMEWFSHTHSTIANSEPELTQITGVWVGKAKMI